jgi:DNA-binding transcriptional regulator YbjK
VVPGGAFAPEVAVAAKQVVAAPAVATAPTVVAAPAAVAPKAVAAPKGAVTPKGERRRYALVSAAAELLCEGGFEAVRHRAVARRAGLPLASTTYYFSSLDDLIASAVAHIGLLEVAQLRARVATLSRRRRSADTTADLLVDLLVGSESETRLTEQLISRYERHIACARLPGLREIQRRSLRQRVDAVAEVIERSGRSARPELVGALICTVDGAVVSALVDDRQDPRAVARSTVIDVIDAVAPIDRRPVPV